MMHATINTTAIMDKFAKMVDDFSTIDIDGAVTAALDELADVLLKQMQEKVKAHYKTGNAYKAVKRTEVIRAGNYQYVEVGAMKIRSDDKDGFHVIYQEYGSPTLQADPWLRPTLENKALIRKTILAVFEKWSVPNVKAA